MATKKIIAYFMHETEQAEAQRLLRASYSTESYVVGEIDEADIPTLESKGLICQTMGASRQAETPGMIFEAISPTGVRARRVSGSAPDGVPHASAAPLPGGAQYYLIQLLGPLVEPWRAELAAKGATLLEHVPQDAYTARLTPSQVAAIRLLSFVEGVREYGQQDAGTLTFESLAPPSAGPNLQMLTFDVRLHDEQDRATVLQWLADRHVAVAGASGRKVRLYALENSSIPDDLAALPAVAQVEQFIQPTLYNDVARELMGIEAVVGFPPGTGLNLTGNGQIVGVADTGIDASHPDFAGRIAGLVALGRNGDSSDPHGHGTHVSGSVLGDGSASGGKIRGAAPAAQLFFQSVMDAQGKLGGLPLNLGDLFEEAYLGGARIHNNSWGSATASMYTMNSSEVDEFIAKRRDMLIVISAGNEGTSATPQKASPGFVDWLSIGSPASAKNALVVGASRSTRTSGGYSDRTYREVWPQSYPTAPIADEKISGDPESLAAFSSRGPCDDRRIKPDLVAPGTDIVSTKASTAPLRNFWGPFAGTPKYAYMGGTSMSAPLVSGLAALVRQYYGTRGVPNPSAALLKATLINGTRWLTGKDATADHTACPNYHQGFGAVDLRTTVPHNGNPSLRLEVIDSWQTPALQFARTGQRLRYHVRASAGLPIRMCLAWTDLPARGTQNSLAFMVQGPNNERWVGNSGLKDALTTPDPDNNVHVLRLDAPPPGDYLIQIFARNLLKPPQDFAFVITGELTTGVTAV